MFYQTSMESTVIENTHTNGDQTIHSWIINRLLEKWGRGKKFLKSNEIENTTY
jgi:hypothetical protein